MRKSNELKIVELKIEQTKAVVGGVRVAASAVASAVIAAQPASLKL